MVITIKTAVHHGLTCVPVSVEVDVAGSWPNLHIVGLPDAAITEAKQRIRAAWRNSNYKFPSTRSVVINLAPADVRKEGAGFDLPMALGIFIAARNQESVVVPEGLVVGELGLDGTVRHTKGILPLALSAKRRGIKEIFVPAVDAAEASLVEGITVIPVATLATLFHHVTGREYIDPVVFEPVGNVDSPEYSLDMRSVRGQPFAKRALEIAAAGGHNVLMTGPPGSGKTLLAKTFASILPPFSREEQIEATTIYSVAGLLPREVPLVTERPFRSPHHSASSAALVGGGRFPKPGEISLAHRGVLFLDELPEFPRPVLETLRQPLEDGVVTISRAHGSVEYPARCILIAGQNPCPCGYATDPDRPCTCSGMARERYQKKISGPLLDRIDMHITVPRVPFDDLAKEKEEESSAHIRARVCVARRRQEDRYAGSGIVSNSEMTTRHIRLHCALDDQSLLLMKQAMEQLSLSARSYYRILRLARTIADLEGSERVGHLHVAEALQYRNSS